MIKVGESIMNQEPDQKVKTGNMAQSIKNVSTGGAYLRLAKSIGFSVILLLLALFFIYLGVPWYFCGVMLLLAIGIIVLEIISLKRIAAVDINAKKAPVALELEPGEFLEETIPAVMQYGKTRSYGVLGAGKVLTRKMPY